MKAQEYGAWPTWNVTIGGQKKSIDPYNRHLKHERFPHAEEYACMNVEEYHHYSEYNDSYIKDKEKRRMDDKSKNSHFSRMRIMQQVICLIVGSTIIVSTYQAMMNRQAEAQPQPTPPAAVQEVEDNPTPAVPAPIAKVASVEWVWDDENKTAMARLFDSDGNLIEEVPAKMSTTTVDPTCNKEGTTTYTASVERDGKSFEDEKTEAIQPLGHSFDKGKETVLDNGQSAMEFECERCHEHFTVATSSTENDE